MPRSIHATFRESMGRLTVWAMLLWLASVAATAPADRLRLADGRYDTSLWVHTISINGQTIDFQVERVNNVKLTGEILHLSAKDIQSIEFREPDEKSDPPQGRVAHMRTVDDEMHYNMVVEQAARTPQGFLFRMRHAPSKAGSEQTDVKQENITMLTFAPPSFGIVKEEIAPEESVKAATKPPKYVGEPKKGGKSSAPTADDPFGLKGFEEAQEEQEKVSMGFGGMFFLGALMALGWAILLAVLGGVLFIVFVVGIFVLKLVTRNEGVDDLSWGRAIACSALLAYVPPTLFFLGVYFVPFFCMLKLSVGVGLFWASSRMIVMGMLEVLEGKATDVLISYYLVFIMLLVCLGIYFQNS